MTIPAAASCTADPNARSPPRLNTRQQLTLRHILLNTLDLSGQPQGVHDDDR